MDLAAVKARKPILDVAQRFVELRKRAGEYVGLCPFHDERTGSFTVRPAQGRFHCFGCGADGDVIDFVIKIGAAADIPSAVEYLGCRDVVADMGAARAELRRQGEARRAQEAEDAEQTRRKAYAIWKDETRPAGETMAEAYLRGRGYTLPIPRTIRFAPALYCHEVRAELPAMVAAIVDARGSFLAVHRTWLARGRDQVVRKAALQAPKKVLGRFAGGAVRLFPMPWSSAGGLTLYVGEGLETSLSILEGLQRRPDRLSTSAVWAGVSLTNMSRLKLPLADNGLDQAFKRVVLVMDADMKDTARALTEELTARERWEDRGIEVRAVYPPAGTDLNDILQAAPAAISPAIAAARGPEVAAILEAFPGATVERIDGQTLERGQSDSTI